MSKKRSPLRVNNEKELLIRNRGDVERANKRILGILLRLTVTMFVGLCLLSLGVPGYTHLTRFYSGMLLLLVIFTIVDWRVKTTRWALHEFYAYLTIFFVYAVLSSAFFTPDALSIVFLLLVMELQLLVTDRTLRINTVCVVFSVIYIVFMLLFKDAQFMYDEIVNVMLMMITGGLIGGYQRRAKLLNFELTRQAEDRERVDFLTGIGSRRKLFEDIARSETGGAKHVCGAMMLDVDLFKQYNDTYGHQAGDDCLRKLGGCFARFGQEHGIEFYRFGGEEFTALSYVHTQEELQKLGEQVNNAVLDLDIPHSSISWGLVSVSIGVAELQNEEHYNPEDLIGLADAALYYAKKTGRNQTVSYLPSMAEPKSKTAC